MAVTAALGGVLLAAACARDANDASTADARREAAPSPPDVAPRMLNAAPPFQYPAALYARKVQGNVVLRLVVDSAGRVQPESTSVAESSGSAALDSAAVRGVPQLTFAPATRAGRPVATSLRFPVHFRHPAARPLPGDSVRRDR